MKRHFTRHYRTKLLVIAAFVCGSAANAQLVANYLQAADNYFRKGDYYNASLNYERHMNSGKTTKSAGFDPYVVQGKGKQQASKPATRAEVVYKTAESYRMLRNFVKAEPYYKEVAEQQQFPHARYWYAKSLRSNSKFAEAEAEFKTFLSAYSAKDSIQADSERELANLQFILSQLNRADVKLYTVNKLSADAQKVGADYAPSLHKGSLVFTSTRAEKDDQGKVHVNRLYTVAANAPAAQAAKLPVPQTVGSHQGVTTFTPDGNTMFFTRWSTEAGKKSAAIYTSRYENGKWSEPMVLGGDVNAAGYNAQQPFVTADGKHLFYTSDKPGGEGKLDIWVASLGADGTASGSANLGKTINTADDEQAPFYFASKKTLIFSNNSRVGMGGYDFFKSEGSVGNWAEPVNMGYPINSVKDDIYLVSNGQRDITDNFYFSSDRNSECCLELYAATKVRPKKVVTGRVLDCNTGAPLAGSAVKIAGGETNLTRTTDETGSYEIVLDDYQPLTVTANKEGFIEKSIEVTTPANIEVDRTANPDICLAVPVIEKPYEENKPIIVDSVFFEFDRYKLRTISHGSLNQVVALMKKYPTSELEISAHTDSKGSDEYNMQLSELRAKSVVEYLVSQGIEASRLRSKGYGETVPIAPNTKPNGKDNPEGRALNRRVEFKIIHY